MGYRKCTDGIEVRTKHSTANLFSAREEGRELVMLSHWRQEDLGML